ncbi:MAG TPA: RHS repeat-associated core domain-containing protein, partial [Pirellulales bacterium]|nr:RHS repeat-associated core domain-containing protein [Pirellulales bacterium]
RPPQPPISGHFLGQRELLLSEHVHFVYDVFDHLIATEADTTGDGTYNQVEHWVLDVSPELPQAGVAGMALAQPVLGFGPTGDLTTRYFEALNQIFAEEAVSSLTQGGTSSWDLVNNLGSVVYVLDDTGAVIDELVYNGFGVVAYESSALVDHFAGFAGGHGDRNTGLVNDYHRWYDPATGRWMSEDPSGFKPGDPNLIRYVDNSPLDRVDPRGLAPNGTPPGPAPAGKKWEWHETTQLIPKTVTAVRVWQEDRYLPRTVRTYVAPGVYIDETVMIYAGTFTMSQAYTKEFTQVKRIGEWRLVNAGTPKNYGAIRAEPDTIVSTGEILGWTIYMFNGFKWLKVGFQPTLKMDPTGFGGAGIGGHLGGSGE